MQDLSRFSIKPIVVNHFSSLRRTGASRMTRRTWATLFLLPVIVAAISAAFQFKLDRGGATALLTATGLLVGAMVTAFIFLANLRIKISESDSLRIRRDMSVLTSETAVACLYCAGLALALSLSLATALAVPRAARPELVHLGATFLIVAGLIHLAINFLTVLRRLFGVYFAVFHSDFVRISEARDPDEVPSANSPESSSDPKPPTRRIQMRG